jgi:hypothetical protein
MSHVRPTWFANISTHAADAFTHEFGRTLADAHNYKIPKIGLFFKVFSGDGEQARTSGLAERVGFEPTVRFPAHTLSKRAP